MSSLYKFVSDPAVAEHFIDGRVKFTPICELNDPSELTGNVIRGRVAESLARIREEGYSQNDLRHLEHQGAVLKRLAPGFQAVSVPTTIAQANSLIRSPFYDRIDLLERLLCETANQISGVVGVFCLTKRYDSLPMWAHYAANATGFVLEFRDLELTFPGDDTGVLCCPREVRYERETGGVTFDPKSHDSLFFEKFRDWSYEQEVRVVVPLSECQVEKLDGGGTLYTQQLPVERLVRLILGWRISTQAEEQVRSSAEQSESPIEIVRARFEGGRVVV